MKDVFKLSVTLALICAIAGAALAATYSVTSTVISERKQAELQRALGELLPAADKFEETSRDGITYFLATKDGRLIGAIMQSAGSGYAGPINLVVAVDMAGAVQGVRITGHRETPGIGDRVTASAFLGQFAGKTARDPLAVGGDVQVISGATLSVRGVTTGVRNALALFQQHVLGGAAPVPVDRFTRDLATVPDGEYPGEGRGLLGPIKVSVTVKSGRVENVRVVAHADTPEYANAAFVELTRAVIREQDPEVDAVSGATGSSEGFVQAVIDALEKAPSK
ncbi:MAG: Electron transport complex subunit RsxG [Firmicutes bacterium]|nr:Electron transport complex subunit RsxG [candidate division NPL-UPA2 bacterium]